VSVIVNIADAVVAELNASGLLPGVTAQRAYRPTFVLEEMKDLHVTVVPRGVEMSGVSRSMVQSDVQIDIGVQKKPMELVQAELDGLMALVEQIADHLRGRRLTGAPDASWVKTENNPIFAAEHLEQLRQFTSVLTVTYRVLR
jgi:hypothetical protein